MIDRYKAIDAVIATTRQQFDDKLKERLAVGFQMVSKGEKNKGLLDEFDGRWSFMKELLEDLADKNGNTG